jgi:membrane protease YdiL (CAAX protease family)
VLANGLSWLVLLVLGGLLGLPAGIVVLFFTVGPIAAAVIMTAIIDGRTGLRHLLRRVVFWRVSLRWYLVALLGIPLVILLATLALPGALASFQPMSPVRWLVTYGVVFVITGIAGGPLFEEPGWRGFALPRLQAQLGPLGGTLLLGVLWGVWHLPQYYLVPAWAEENGGRSLASVGTFLLIVLALAPLMTWLFNHTQGSVLLAILAHASVNTAQLVVVNQLFPSAANETINLLLAFAVVALVLIVVTRGRLGYSEEGLPRRRRDGGDGMTEEAFAR